MDRNVIQWGGQPTEVRHRNGVPWYDVPIPHRWHRCRPHTSGWMVLRQFQRCACGAYRDVYRGRWSGWAWKNTRRTFGLENNSPI